MIRKLVVAMAVLLAAAQIAAAAPGLLTLEDCLAITAKKNRDIRTAREYAELVEGRYVEERAAALPQLALQGSLAYAKDDSIKALYGTAQLQSSRTVDLSLTQPLFTWGKVSAAIRAAEVGLQTADQRLRLYRQAAFREVSAAFYDLLLARELHRLAQENLAQKERHRQEAQRKFDSGVATDYDLLAAEVEVENARPEVIRNANSIRIAKERLRFLLGIGQEEFEVSGRIGAVPDTPPSYEEALAIALDKRPELADQRLKIGIYNEMVTIAEADDKPRLDLKGSAGWHQLELSNPGPVQRSDGPAWNAGLYLTFPFFDGLRTSGKVQQAKSELRTRQIEELKLKDSIALDVRTAHYTLAESAEIIGALSGTVRQAQKLLRMSEQGFEYGVKTRLDVADAQTNLLRAETNLLRATRDYLVAQVNLRWTMGVLGE